MIVSVNSLPAVTVTNLSPASRGRPSPRALKPRLRYKLKHGVVGGVYYNLYAHGARTPPHDNPDEAPEGIS